MVTCLPDTEYMGLGRDKNPGMYVVMGPKAFQDRYRIPGSGTK